jgi:hypothetical protein
MATTGNALCRCGNYRDAKSRSCEVCGERRRTKRKAHKHRTLASLQKENDTLREELTAMERRNRTLEQSVRLLSRKLARTERCACPTDSVGVPLPHLPM